MRHCTRSALVQYHPQAFGSDFGNLVIVISAPFTREDSTAELFLNCVERGSRGLRVEKPE
jgi:hypothetical protein